MRDRLSTRNGSIGRTRQRRAVGTQGFRRSFRAWGRRNALTAVGALCVFAIAAPLAWQTRSASAADSAGDSFSFAASGDHARNAQTTKSLDALRTSGTAFHLALGDLSYDSSEASWCDMVKSHVGKDFPFQLVAGNHEEKQMAEFTKCLPDHMGSTGTYGEQYWFDYPKQSPLARFVLISPDIEFPGAKAAAYTASSDRYRWVSDSIDDARSHGIRWVVVGMHKTCITAGVKKCEIGEDLMNLLVRKKVDLVLQAHEHNYQRGKQLAIGEGCDAVKSGAYKAACVADDGKDGAYTKGAGSVIVIDGTFGQTLYDVSAKDPEAGYFAKLMGKNATPTHGFVRYTVTKDRLSAELTKTDGGKFSDSFAIETTGATGDGGEPSPEPSESPEPAPTTKPSPTPKPSPSPVEGEATQGIRYVGVSTGSTGNAKTSTLKLDRPDEARRGDLLLAVLGADYGHIGTPPEGWTLIEQEVKKGDDLAIQSYYKVAGYKVAGAEEPETTAWSIVSGGKPAAKGLGVGSILVFRGVDQKDPVFASAIRAQTPDRTKLECPSVEGPSGGVLVCGYMVDDPDTIAMPKGVEGVGTMTVRGDDTFAVGYESRSSAGPTGIRAASMNNVGGGSDDFSHAVMLRPASR